MPSEKTASDTGIALVLLENTRYNQRRLHWNGSLPAPRICADLVQQPFNVVFSAKSGVNPVKTS